MSSIIRGSDNFDSAEIPGEIQGARVWCCYDGTGTVSITSDYNVSSLTDNGTGRQTVNFTPTLPNANYAVVACSGNSSYTHTANVHVDNVSSKTTTSVLLETHNNNTSSAEADHDNVSMAVFHT